MNDTTLDILNLSSYGGISLASMFGVEILKRAFGNVAVFKKIPVFVYACVIAAILAFLANHVFYIDGKPMLQGTSVWIAIGKSVFAAATASGFYTWLRNPEAPETASKLGVPAVKSQIIPLFAALLLMVGCASPTKTVLRESISQAVMPAMDENISLVTKIANGQPLPKFDAGDIKIRQDNKDAVQKLIDEDRKADADGGFLGIGK